MTQTQAVTVIEPTLSHRGVIIGLSQKEDWCHGAAS